MRKQIHLQIFTVLLGLNTIVHAQQADSIFQLVDSIAIEAKFIASDQLANLYVVTATNEIIKYGFTTQANQIGNTMQEQFRFNNNTLGDLSLIDATNPFNLLLYYPDFQTAIILDRTMNETNRFDFIELGVPSVNAIALSNDNQIWYYDELDFKLKKINSEGTISAQSEDLNLVINQIPQVSQVRALGNWVFLNDPQLGIIIFDQFGQYHQIIDQTQVEQFQVITEALILKKEKQFIQYNWQFQNAVKLPLPKFQQKFQQASWQRQHLYISTQHQVCIFRF